MARGDDSGLARRGEGEPGDSRVRRSSGYLQDYLVWTFATAGVAALFPLEHQLRQYDKGRGAETVAVRADLL